VSDLGDNDEAPPLGGSPRKREKRPEARSRSKTETRTDSRTTDLAAISRAIGEAHAAGASQGRVGFDGVQGAYVQLLGQLATANGLIATLQSQLMAAQSQNPALALLQAQALAEGESKKVESLQRWQTVRELGPQLAGALGPHAGPFLAFAAKKLGIVDEVSAPEAGDKSPRAAVQRVARRLRDGSEESIVMAGMVQEYVTETCGEDFAVVMKFITDAVSGPGAASTTGSAAP